MAESTPVSSVMRASTLTLPPFAEAFTSEMAGGFVSSARAARARAKTAARATNGKGMAAQITPRTRRRNALPNGFSDQPRSAQSALRGEALLLLRGGGGGGGELDADRLADARLFHGDAVERVGDFHGALVVGDDDELGGAAHLAHHLVVAADVGLVERGVDFVEKAERRRL